MKKFLIITIAIILVLALFGCGKDKTTSTEQDSGTAEIYETDSEEPESAVVSEDLDTSDESSKSDSGVLSSEFKKTMDDYEAWFDHYCDVMERYQEDSTDLKLLSEMTDLLTEETTMLEEMENMDQDDMNAAELAYYLEVTARIEKRLLEAAY